MGTPRSLYLWKNAVEGHNTWEEEWRAAETVRTVGMYLHITDEFFAVGDPYSDYEGDSYGEYLNHTLSTGTKSAVVQLKVKEVL